MMASKSGERKTSRPSRTSLSGPQATARWKQRGGLGRSPRWGRRPPIAEGGIGQVIEGVKRGRRQERVGSGLGESVERLAADQGREPRGGCQSEEETVAVDDAVEGVLIAPFTQDHAGFLVALGTPQAYPPPRERLAVIGSGTIAGQIPGFLRARVPHREEADRNRLVLAVEGERAQDPLPRTDPEDHGRWAAPTQARDERFGEADVGLGVEAADQGTPEGLVETDKRGPGEAPIGDGDPGGGPARGGRRDRRRIPPRSGSGCARGWGWPFPLWLWGDDAGGEEWVRGGRPTLAGCDARGERSAVLGAEGDR